MRLLDRFFAARTNGKEKLPNIRFGRYSDSYKSDENHQYWKQSLAAFEQADFLASYRYFFEYLRDEQEDNVRYTIDDTTQKIDFEFIQGSKKITGSASEDKFNACVKVAKTNALNLGLMRRLLERNYSLKYSRFALDQDNHICIHFDTYTLDGSPYKLYYALKELAINADKQDDLLLDEFKEILSPVEIKHLQLIPSEEKEAKYHYIKSSIQRTLNEIENGELPPKKYPGATAYKLLSLTYKLDYLIKPEGYMMETLERIHRIYFEENKRSTVEKNDYLIAEFKKLLAREKTNYFKEFYRTTATFGITSPENHNRVSTFIEGELPNIGWYIDNEHEATALAIPSYIVGYSQFNYAVPKPDKELFRLFYRIVENDYFLALGYTTVYYDTQNNRFDKKAIKRAFEEIRVNNLAQFPKLQLSVNKLNLDNLVQFSKSYLLMMKDLNLIKKVKLV